MKRSTLAFYIAVLFFTAIMVIGILAEYGCWGACK